MKKLAFLFFMFIGLTAIAQQANDCSDAIVVCGNTNISSNVSGFGLQELDGTVNPCTYEELNSLWLSVNIAVGGTLAFTLRPDDTALEVDYDFYIFGPNNGCGNFDNPIRCSTTNPLQASLTNNLTGLRDSETDQNEGPGELGNSYVSSIPVLTGEQYYILIDRPIGNGGFNLEWTGTAGFLPSPIVNQPNSLEVCANDPNTILDITQQEALITSSTTATISYYSSFADAFDYNNRITDPTQFAYAGNYTQIYVRVTNPNGCFEIVDFDISPLVFDPPPSLAYTLCDSDRDGTEDFSITQITTDIENSIGNIMEFLVSLHPSETTAIANTNRITNANYSSGSTEIYARVTSALDANCTITYPVALIVIDDPYPASISLIQCDVDEVNSIDGLTRTNLEQAFLEVSGVQIFYYTSIADRNLNNPIPNPQNYTNTIPFNETIYYKIISDQCESIGEIVLQVNSTTTSLNIASPFMSCDDDSADGILESTFDLEFIRQNSFTGVEAAFYSNLADVSLEQNPLSGNFRTTSTTIFVRLENNNQCQGVDEIELVVNPNPEVELGNDYQVCTGGEPLIIDAPLGFDRYTWYKINNGQPEELGTESQLRVTEGGDYRLEVETQYQNNGQELACSGTTDFTVTPSNVAIIQEIKIEESIGGNIVEIEVTGDGDYEYSLDGENYQESSRFDTVESGFYTIYVRDTNGCGISNEEISIVGFPKFFTPNGDGANDTWQITGANQNFEDQVIRIFDRYGKLVKQLRTNDNGWDGSMNGKLLPSSDYWFRFNGSNGKEFKGHFSLKR